MNKTTIRSQLQKIRTALSDEESNTLSDRIVLHVIQSDLYKQAQHVALYLPVDGEVDLTALLTDKSKHHYIPSIEGQQMQFHLYNPQLPMEQHRYGITQPIFDTDLTQAPIELCLMPLVGFDKYGNRLGMGGGFYDRYFATNETNNTQLAGVAYQFQQHDKLPAQSWDVRINHLFTEHGYTKL